MKITNSMHRHKLIPDDPHMGLWSYAYDALPLQGASRANLTRQADARGQRICLYYDGLNRLTGKHYRQDDSCPASPTLNVAYGYDAVCQRTSMTDASGSTCQHPKIGGTNLEIGTMNPLTHIVDVVESCPLR